VNNLVQVLGLSWMFAFPQTLDTLSFDYILASETLYSPAAETMMLSLIKNHLAPGGTALLAARTFYFGVGGGVSDLFLLTSCQGLAILQGCSLWSRTWMDDPFLKSSKGPFLHQWTEHCW